MVTGHDNSGVIRLGLIGDKIAASRSPVLHQTAGELTGLVVRYDLLVPKAFGLDFDALLDHCVAAGYRGLNVTYPYKEPAFRRSHQVNDDVRIMGAANTLLLTDAGIIGRNTDYSGFITAWRRTFGDLPPGDVALVGAGGVGKAVGFALLALGAHSLRIYDLIAERSAQLAQALNARRSSTFATAVDGIDACMTGATGLVNCTPVGMTGNPGTALPARLMRGATWAFDAVYIPVDTEFLRDAATAGLRTMDGYELLFYQGVDAFEHFTGRRPDEQQLRQRVQSQGKGT